MRIPLGSSTIGGAWTALALLAAFSVAEASNGRISFSGAVAEPTCMVAAQRLATSLVAMPADARAPARLVCNRTATDPGRFYVRTVISLDATTIANNRLLDYFASYANAKAVDGQRARLVIRTYE